MLFRDVEFECPHCGKTHNLRDFLEMNLSEGNTRLDAEFVEECLMEDGRTRLSFPYCECRCGQQFIVDIDNGWHIIIYDDQDCIVEDMEYKGGI